MSTTPVPRIGRPPHEPTKRTRDTVRLMSASGISQDKIADCIGIDPTTLRDHYRRELDLALAEVIAGVFGSIYQKAMSPTHAQAAVCGMFILNTRGKFRRMTAVVGGDADDPPVRVAHDVDLSALNRDQLAALLALADAVPAPTDDTDDEPLVDL